jgi:chromosome segregation ATPase
MASPDMFVVRQGATMLAQHGRLDLLSFFEHLAGTKPLKQAVTVTQSELDLAVTAAITLNESMILSTDDKGRALEPEVQKSKQYQAAPLYPEVVQSAVLLYAAVNLSAAVTAADEEVQRIQAHMQCAKAEHAELEPTAKGLSAAHQTAVTELNSVKAEHRNATTAVTKADTLAAALQAKAARCAFKAAVKQKELKRVSTPETEGTSEKEKIEQRLAELTADELKIQHASESNKSGVNDAIKDGNDCDADTVTDTCRITIANTDVCREDKKALLDLKQQTAAQGKSLQAALTELAVGNEDHNGVNKLLQSKKRAIRTSTE